ncbi:MAG: Tex family protein [Candidatus Kapabacteria bacterium]|nr:Tex family protein [Candidatus Kapabacteria bacterium]
MFDIKQFLTAELKTQAWQVENALKLKEDNCTVPFIARYRKEMTGSLDENVLRDLFDRFDYLTELEDRKKTIIKSIEEQGKMTDELMAKILACTQKTELEDLYLPFKPKRRTRATIAKERGLEPLAILIKEHNTPNSPIIDLNARAMEFVSGEKDVPSATEALKGAADIIAEEISEIAELRGWLRDFIASDGTFRSKIKSEFPEGSTKYEMYREFSSSARSIQAHNMLALRRGENEGIVVLDMDFDEEAALDYIRAKTSFALHQNIIDFYKALIKDSFNRLMKISIISEVRLAKKSDADLDSITVFETNLRQLLLASPAGMKPTIGIDPGFRTGCKVAVLDSTSKYMEYKTIFPFNSEREKEDARKTILHFIDKYKIELIAIGNGTAGRETEEFISDLISKMEKPPIKVMVSEAGASVYSASKVANEEFPELDLTVRGAISISRRLQDPLAELVKIDPKSIGVGQYQHDVDQKLLKKKLEETVVSCVNFVGVDLNTASAELLNYISGINSTIAKNIIKFRDDNGAFNSRRQLLKVGGFGPKAFEQSAGFLRIRNADNPLDSTAVHPESYSIVQKMADDLQIKLADITKSADKLKQINLKNYINDKVGEPTLRDIISELEKPGRDPRAAFKYATFSEGVKEIRDLRVGMILEGVVTNIANFGAFVDIGVHQDGLVHISEIANRFITNPASVLKVGQIVQTKVLEVNEQLKRIKLSIKQAAEPNAQRINTPLAPKPQKEFNLNDLSKRFQG